MAGWPERRFMTLRGLHCALGGAAVQHIRNVIHVRNQPSLDPMDSRRAKSRFERGHFRIVDATRPDDPAPAIFGYLERGLAGEDPAQRGQRFCVETPAGFFVEL